jgi:hypothetical protein
VIIRLTKTVKSPSDNDSSIWTNLCKCDDLERSETGDGPDKGTPSVRQIVVCPKCKLDLGVSTNVGTCSDSQACYSLTLLSGHGDTHY